VTEAISRSDRISGYASALLAVAGAEADAARISDELSSVARAFATSDELRATLADQQLPFERKQAVVEELVGAQTAHVTTSLVHMLVAIGRIEEFEEITAAMRELAAASESYTIAEVRSAVPLDPETVARLEAKLSSTTGKRVRAEVIVDPKLLGGVVARVGDTVFDGSVRTRLQDLREVWGG
jgi:F-type H+-transporting ATPase subunit delta